MAWHNLVRPTFGVWIWIRFGLVGGRRWIGKEGGLGGLPWKRSGCKCSSLQLVLRLRLRLPCIRKLKVLSRSSQCVLNKYMTASEARPASLKMMITGSIPPGSGLSSSAALIVAALLAILLGNGLVSATPAPSESTLSSQVKNSDLVQMAREAEAKIGVNSGGMDQSASVLSRVGAGLYVSFVPELGVEMVQLPSISKGADVDVEEEKLVMVIANSLTKHDLAGGATKQYNLRVMETLIGARVLGRALGVIQDGEKGVEKLQLRQVVGRFAGEQRDSSSVISPHELESALEKILREVDRILGPDAESRDVGHLPEGLASLTGLSDEAFERVFLSTIEVDTSDQGGRFLLYKRVRHVFEEALRVLQVVRICRGGSGSKASADGGEKAETDVEIVGRLMNESHASCRDLYECSNDELNELVDVCRRAGSVGSRLSG
jgi:galactokinase